MSCPRHQSIQEGGRGCSAERIFPLFPVLSSSPVLGITSGAQLTSVSPAGRRQRGGQEPGPRGCLWKCHCMSWQTCSDCTYCSPAGHCSSRALGSLGISARDTFWALVPQSWVSVWAEFLTGISFGHCPLSPGSRCVSRLDFSMGEARGSHSFPSPANTSGNCLGGKGEPNPPVLLFLGRVAPLQTHTQLQLLQQVTARPCFLS